MPDSLNPLSGLTDSTVGRTIPTVPTQELTNTDFLQLLAAQLQYQDMSSPMSNSEMLQQLTQMNSITSMNSLVTAISDLSYLSLTSYATSMVGKEVTIAEKIDADGNITKKTGVITGITLYEGTPMVCVDGKTYDIGKIMSMGTVPDSDAGEGDSGTDSGSDSSGGSVDA